MIDYEINGNVVVAKFVEDGEPLSIIWGANLFAHINKFRRRMHYEIDNDTVVELIDKVLKDRRLVGIAKCHEHDTFNEEVGKELAKIDLLARYHKAETQLKIEFLKLLSKDADILTPED